MSLFAKFEKTIERGFRHWTEKMFGPAQSNELLLVHRAILEEIESKVQTLGRGVCLFPFAHVTVTLFAADATRRAVLQAAFAEAGRLDTDIRQVLEGAGCELPRGFLVEVRVAEHGPGAFEVTYGMEAPKSSIAPAAEVTARLEVVRGKADREEYLLDRPRTNIGRMDELTDAEHRVVRRNDVVFFEEGGDPANTTVSRKHAHIRRTADEYRLCDDESEFGTRIFRDGRQIEVPPGNRRGERLKPGDEIYLGRACLRFVR
jgi:FHA domain-containing protein